MEVAQQYIRSQYSTLANGNLKSISKAQLYYSIITIKTDHPALANEYQSLYKDVKMFIEAYADELSCMDYGYDQPNTDKLEKVCENLTNAQQRSILNIVYIRYSQYNDVVKWVKLYKSKNAIRFSCEKFKWYNPWSWIDILANLVLCNWGSIIIFLLILLDQSLPLASSFYLSMLCVVANTYYSFLVTLMLFVSRDSDYLRNNLNFAKN